MGSSHDNDTGKNWQGWSNCAAAAARDCPGVRMYWWYAAERHCPSVWIDESSIPTSAAAVAAPMRKLWPVTAASAAGSIPDDIRASRTATTNRRLVSGKPSWNRNRGPWACPRKAIYANTADTGQISWCVRPKSQTKWVGFGTA